MNQQCEEFRKVVLLFFPSLLDDKLLIQSFTARAKNCCGSCRFFLSSRLAIEAAIQAEGGLAYFEGEKKCFIAANSEKLLRMSFDVMEEMKRFGVPTSLKKSRHFYIGPINEEMLLVKTKWIMHGRECESCTISYERLLESAEEFQEIYRLAIETDGEILPPPNSVRNIPSAARIM